MNKIISSPIILSKFRGCLLGGLVGDCCGAPYEGEKLHKSEKMQLHKCLDELEAKKVKVMLKPYTDDTAMTIALAECLIQNNSLPHKELASYYCQSYFKNPNRGFGGAVPRVLFKLRETKLEDPLKPAKEQFNGSGSYGNGAAMRVAPVGIFCLNKDIDQLITFAKNSAIITHSHRLAINGAILQALAISYCLKKEPAEFNSQEFLNHLRNQLKTIEYDEMNLKLGDSKGDEYQQQITKIEELLLKKLSNEMVVNYLGNSVEALFSVPTAIYCFLKAQESLEEIQTENIFRRTIQYAIHLGGDTDTIASMAGSLSGALYGEEIISKNILSYCEAHDKLILLADDLYKLCT